MSSAQTSAEAGQQVAESTAREHATLVRAVDALERALAAPVAGDERGWRERTRHGLAAVVGFLQEHCESAEQQGGLVREAHARIGQPVSVTRVRRDHDRLARDAVKLLAALEENDSEPSLTCEDVRLRAGALTSRLRRHQALEADLLYDAFGRDLGVLD